MSESHIRFNMVEDNLEPEVVTSELLTVIDGWLKQEGAYTTDVQQQMLESHVKAMVLRAKTGEPLPEVDKSLFDEISAESMALAERAVNALPGLPIEEAYLLSVHFEIARSNA
ncbi:transcriptional antiterminator [Budviciaceae bacterium CWB-B4]|uniref:Transcriptional antiterminator n=3 Tax=Limnobaculum TaxID=2172100 RepID=A0A9D7FXV1_9GAMM|nr:MULTISPECIES: transcriptional antiterminator [Limnobaculum]MBK5073157.1 transcriptional antiterminator [Limnobaculum xujianqingii]MBK5176466.1 transcriptional antiterminator [Limnobaculum xujianqingii]MCD1126774.1 transcriptional antiterminator [Limnobaculum eriocheiris]QBH96168.1 transcriptional antiterminator [Limnobaculum zhutongyuii]TQS87301.1 transcriptional antiterminator [Limnobaculum zhutongyuii]